MQALSPPHKGSHQQFRPQTRIKSAVIWPHLAQIHHENSLIPTVSIPHGLPSKYPQTMPEANMVGGPSKESVQNRSKPITARSPRRRRKGC